MGGDDLSIHIEVVTFDQKLAAVLDCLRARREYTIRELRECAVKRVAISEKMVSKILHQLYKEGRVRRTRFRWVLVENENGGNGRVKEYYDPLTLTGYY